MNDDESKGSTTRRPSARAILGLLPVLLAATGGMVLMEPRRVPMLDPEPDGENCPSPFSAAWAEQAASKILDLPTPRATLPASPSGTRSKAERKARRRARRMRAKGGR